MPLRTPGWYAPPKITASQQQAVRDDLTTMSDRFSEAVQGTQPFAIELTQEQVNNWLTMRGEMWPAAKDALPAPWSEPFVLFDAGRVTLAARCDAIPSRPIVSAALDVRMENGEIVLRVAGVHCGSVPVPLSFIGSQLEQSFDIWDEGTGVHAKGDLVGGVRMNTRHTWWNGRREYRVADVQLSKGLLRFEIEPRPK